MAIAPPPISGSTDPPSVDGTGGGVASGIEIHEPVLVNELLELLSPKKEGVYVDGTLGNAGHALALLKIVPNGILLGLDQDAEILEMAKERLQPFERVRILQRNFSNLKEVLAEQKMGKADGIYLDLGVSSLQLDQAARGFSFRKEGPIDMRMNPSRGEPVLNKIINSDERELASILKEYGEEPYANKIARGLLEKGKRGELQTTLDIAQVAFLAYPPQFRHGRTHPATKTFQALRIWVNEELDSLRDFLKQAPSLLKKEGRVCIISYHSLEDRLVKHKFRELAKGDDFELLTKKPMRPSEEEMNRNPRSRSAKLRGLKKLH